MSANTSLDHIIPRSKGGTNEYQNLQFITKWANTAKHNYSEEEFIGFIKRTYEHLDLGNRTYAQVEKHLIKIRSVSLASSS